MDRYKRYSAAPGCGCNAARAARPISHQSCEANVVPLAMPVMPIQELRELYKPCEALERGTLYAELYKPYCIRGGCR